MLIRWEANEGSSAKGRGRHLDAAELGALAREHGEVGHGRWLLLVQVGSASATVRCVLF